MLYCPLMEIEMRKPKKNMDYSNSSIDVSLLPTIQSGEFIRLENGYLKIILMGNIITSLILLTGFGVLYYTDAFAEMGNYWWLTLVFIISFLIFLFWFRPKAFARKGYQLRERDIVYQHGLWWQEETVIPFVRIQHSEVTQGPLERIYGFSSLKLFTAGGNKSDLSIPALSTETAHKLENYVTQKAELDAKK